MLNIHSILHLHLNDKRILGLMSNDLDIDNC